MKILVCDICGFSCDDDKAKMPLNITNTKNLSTQIFMLVRETGFMPIDLCKKCKINVMKKMIAEYEEKTDICFVIE